MSHEDLERLDKTVDAVAERAAEVENLGQMPEETVANLRESGVIRMLQPAEFGGYECDPRDFFEAVMRISAVCGSTGWCTGIIGVHAFEMGMCDHRLQEAVWGEDPDTWIASPYMPIGRARPVDGGFVISGRWPFSSGTDHCSWAFLGGVVTDQDGKTAKPVDMRHFVLARGEYTIIDGTWDTWGLRGTGSKDVEAHEIFVPDHRALPRGWVVDGDAGRENRPTSPLYQVPFSAIFAYSITAAIVGMAEGVLAAHIATERDRVNVRKLKMSEDPWGLSNIGEAASEIHACRLQVMENVGMMYEMAQRGERVPFELRARGRRDQVRCSWRAVQAVEQVFTRSGGNTVRNDRPLQRLWRDIHAALVHQINVYGPIYSVYANVEMGLDVDNYVGLTI